MLLVRSEVCDSGVPFDGGPIHKKYERMDKSHNSKTVEGSNTLLLIKPHPHEFKETIACYLNEYFFDLIDNIDELPENILLGHKWFDIHMLEEFLDFGLIYNGTTSVELGVLGIPSVLCSHFYY